MAADLRTSTVVAADIHVGTSTAVAADIGTSTVVAADIGTSTAVAADIRTSTAVVGDRPIRTSTAVAADIGHGIGAELHPGAAVAEDLETVAATAAEWDYVKRILPSDDRTKVCSVTALEGSQSHGVPAVRIEARIAVGSKEEFDKWLREHQTLSCLTYRVKVTRPRKGKVVKYNAVYRCQHNTRPKSQSGVRPTKKHTNCPALLSVKIKAVCKNNSSKDTYLPHYPGVITIIHNHNHRIQVAEALCYRDPSEETRKKFMALFKAGHSPKQSIEMHKKDLMEEYGDQYSLVARDRSICPDIRWAYYVYYRVFKGMKRNRCTKKMAQSLSTQIDKLEKSGVQVAFTQKDDDFIIAMCTPLMERVHTLQTTGEICLIDSSGNKDRCNCRVYLLMTDSRVGGLPIGVLITSSAKQELLVSALATYVEMLPDCCFGTNGKAGPSIWMTDDSVLLRNSLFSCFPTAQLLLCMFHMLQATWRWLWDSKHKIKPRDRPSLYALVSKLAYSRTAEEFEESFSNAMDRDDYPNFVKYLESRKRSASEWALFGNSNLSTRGNYTNNISEVAFRVFKDKVLHRTRAYSISQLVEFVAVEMEAYYERKITDLINGRYDQYLQSLYKPDTTTMSVFHVDTLCPGQLYTVKCKQWSVPHS